MTKHTATSFWNWFSGFSKQIPLEFPDHLQDELLHELHKYDQRLYFLASVEAVPSELIISAQGDFDAFDAVDLLVEAAPDLKGWKFVSLKQAQGFNFWHSDGPISLDVSKLWFLPLKSSSDPSLLGLRIGFPDVDFVLENQSVDTAYTILETAIGERECTMNVQYVTVTNLPEFPIDDGYLQLSELPEYIAFHQRSLNVD